MTVGDQFSSWDEDAKHGLFTKHLLTALGGTADGRRFGNSDGNVSVGEVKKYLDREMTYQARRRYNRDQGGDSFRQQQTGVVQLRVAAGMRRVIKK